MVEGVDIVGGSKRRRRCKRSLAGKRSKGTTPYSSFLRFPLGAGSSGVTGLRVYVTVRVTTCLTLTGR